MVPVWIINLTGKDTGVSTGKGIDLPYLKQLLTALPEENQPYWYYTEIASGPMTDEGSCRLLLDELLEEGRACYNHFQKNGFVVNNLQVCIVGAVTETVTRTSFHLLPSLLRDFLPSIQSGYVHRGIEITGLLFVPHNMNQTAAAERTGCALFMEELNTLVTQLDVDTYNRIVVFQDIQRPDIIDRFYRELNKRQLAEFVFQLLLHMYYCDDRQPKIFDASELNKSGFYALGAASIYYDSREHKERKAFDVLEKLVGMMKDPQNVLEGDTDEMVSMKFPAVSISADTVLERLKENCQGLNVDLKTLEALPDPHPVTAFYKAKLYISYFLDYLKFMPARALEFMRLYAHMLTKKLLGQIEENQQKLKAHFETVLGQYDRIFIEEDYRYPSFPQLKAALEELKARFEKEKEQAEVQMNREERTVFEVPDYLSVYYQRFKQDRTELTEKEIAAKMREELRQEPTVMAVLNRSLLLGMVMVFVLMPLLRYISPFIINLGDVDKYAYLWIPFIFLSPFLYQFGVRLRRHFSRIRNYKRMLLAQALVKVQHKASASLYKQTTTLYAEMIDACDGAIEKYERLEEALQVGDRNLCRPAAPPTIFNQPLVEGSFNGKKVLLKPDNTGDDIRIGEAFVKLPGIRDDDYLKLLGEILKNPGSCLFQIPVDPDEALEGKMKSWIDDTWRNLCDRLKINETTCVSKVVNDLSQKSDSAVDLNPLFRMAWVNGVITDSTSEKGCIIRSYQALVDIPKDTFRVRYYENDKEIESFIFVTTWSRPDINKLNSMAICDTGINLPDYGPLPFSTLLTCYYAQYKRKDNFYCLGDMKVPVTTGMLRELELTINKMRP